MTKICLRDDVPFGPVNGLDDLTREVTALLLAHLSAARDFAR